MYKRAWAQLLAKVYKMYPFVCQKFGSEMKCRDRSSLRCGTTLYVIAFIQEPEEIKRILRHSGCRVPCVPVGTHYIYAADGVCDQVCKNLQRSPPQVFA